jgi:Bacterial mobilisation protein (MobC)
MAEDKKRAVTARRAMAEQRRTRRFVMLMSDQDHARIKQVADSRGVSIARLLQESALSESYDRRERLATIAALDSANRLLANVAGNINQLAHHANIAQQLVAHTELEQTLTQLREVREQLVEVLRNVNNP